MKLMLCYEVHEIKCDIKENIFIEYVLNAQHDEMIRGVVM